MTDAHLTMLLQGAALLLGSAGLGVWLKYLNDKRKIMLEERSKDDETDHVNFNTILKVMREQRDEAWVKVAEQDTRIQRLEDEIIGLRVARDLDPFPNWIVGAEDFTYLFVNREFEQIFLRPDGKTYRDIIGKRHEDVWPEAFCRTIYALNDAAKARPDGTARAKTTLEIPRIGEAQVTVHKFPVKAQPSGVIVAWAGFITGIDPSGRDMG